VTGHKQPLALQKIGRPSPQGQTCSLDWGRALRLIGRCPDGCTDAILLAHGFSIGMLAKLVMDRLAATKVEKMRTGGRTLMVVRLRITDAGIRAIGS
jgi:hypothetical protein